MTFQSVLKEVRDLHSFKAVLRAWRTNITLFLAKSVLYVICCAASGVVIVYILDVLEVFCQVHGYLSGVV